MDNNKTMREEILLLGEIQEMELIIEESSILHRSSNEADQIVEKLRCKLMSMRGKSSPELLQRYDRMRTKGPAVVNEYDGKCTGCRLKLTKGDLQRMQNGESPWVCPNCFKFMVLNSQGK